MGNPELEWAKDLLAQATTAKGVQEQAAYLVSCLGVLILVLEQAIQDSQLAKPDIEEPVDWGPGNDPYAVTSTVLDGMESSEVT